MIDRIVPVGRPPAEVEGKCAMELTTNVQLTGRDRAILRAVAAGNAELAWGAEPDLFLEGRCCCDQVAAHRLARAGYIAPATVCTAGQRVAACLTDAGVQQLGALAAA